MMYRGGVLHGTGNRVGRSSASCTSSIAKLPPDAVGLGPLLIVSWEHKSKTYRRFVTAGEYVSANWPRFADLVSSVYLTVDPPRGWHAHKSTVRGCAQIRGKKWQPRDIWVRKIGDKSTDQYVRTLVHELHHLFQARHLHGNQFSLKYHRSFQSEDKYESAARRMGELAAKRFRSA